eukprot:m.57327 g.57327  ORF g.57327 m.57327 type:complete len:117 (+) comp9346_c0_seq2:2389-2739(+)
MPSALVASTDSSTGTTTSVSSECCGAVSGLAVAEASASDGYVKLSIFSESCFSPNSFSAGSDISLTSAGEREGRPTSQLAVTAAPSVEVSTRFWMIRGGVFPADELSCRGVPKQST